MWGLVCILCAFDVPLCMWGHGVRCARRRFACGPRPGRELGAGWQQQGSWGLEARQLEARQLAGGEVSAAECERGAALVLRSVQPPGQPPATQVERGGRIRTWASAARSGPRFGPPWFMLLACYENLTAPNAIMQS